MARPHAVVVPYPCSGNINPALQLAKLLHHHGVYVTFVNTEHNHRRMQDTEGAGAVRGRDGFRFEAIPDGLSEADRGKQDYGQSLLVSTSQCCAAPLRDLIRRLNGAPGVPPVTCVLPTGLMTFALGVARELGIPSVAFWCGGAASLLGYMMTPELKRREYVPLKDESFLTNGYLETTIIDWIPGMPPISLGDISGFIRTTDPDDMGLRISETEPKNCTKADALILNTFEDLDADVLATLRAMYPCIYTIGPLGSLLRSHHLNPKNGATANDSIGDLSLWKQDAGCLSWLETQEQRSVVYVNFGSHTMVLPEQLAEFAWGLTTSGHPFLWTVRDDAILEKLQQPPCSFAGEMTARRCLVTTWCSQEQVLSHPAVGCFLTHNGWNSTCESLAAGVPMVCWPGFADQFTNCKYACDVWGVGIRLDADVRREQVAKHIKEVMASQEMPANAARWRDAVDVATGPGGSSYKNLLSMVRALRS